jgi:hypothetical protein
MLMAVFTDGPPDRKYVPAFTSEAKAQEYILSALARGGPLGCPFALNNVTMMGRLLDSLVVVGHSQMAIDPVKPENPDDADRIAIRAATDAMRRHIRPPSLN